MSNKVFQQNLDDKKGPQPGGPYLIQIQVMIWNACSLNWK